MKSEKDIRSRIEETLASLEGIQRAEASPFFFQKLQNRLTKEYQSTWEIIGNFLSRPAVFGAILLAVLLSNASAIYQSTQDETAIVQNSSPTDYQTALASNYESEISEP
jgi:hypothetical protein